MIFFHGWEATVQMCQQLVGYTFFNKLSNGPWCEHQMKYIIHWINIIGQQENTSIISFFLTPPINYTRKLEPTLPGFYLQYPSSSEFILHIKRKATIGSTVYNTQVPPICPKTYCAARYHLTTNICLIQVIQLYNKASFSVQFTDVFLISS